MNISEDTKSTQPSNSSNPESFNDSESKQEKITKKRDTLLEKVGDLVDSDLLSRIGILLNHYPSTRNSDIDLQLKYWEMYEKHLLNGKNISFEGYREATRLTSITRNRAFIQNTLGLFQASPEIQELRGVAKDEIETTIKQKKPDYPISYVFVDESGKNDTNIVVGSIWFLDELIMHRFSGELLDWKVKENCKGEIKFKNINGNNFKAYSKLIDIILANSSLVSFKAIILKRFGLPSVQDAICKMFSQLIVTGIDNEIETGRVKLPRYLQVVKDAEEESLDKLLLSEMQERLNNYSSRHDKKLEIFKCTSEDSRQNPFLQIADLFTGSIRRYLVSTSVTEPKDALAKYFLDATGAFFNLAGYTGKSDIVTIF